jgi:hypothetical protein
LAIDDDRMAAAIHETWRVTARSEGRSMAPGLDSPFAELPEAAKDDNRAAARRMPTVLAVAGLAVAGVDDRRHDVAPADWEAILAVYLEAMAQVEHDGWMAHRASGGWRWGPTRDDASKRHPSMIAYAGLSETEKDKDRGNVRHYPDFVARAGARIVRLT